MHGRDLREFRNINVSVEVTGYFPVDLVRLVKDRQRGPEYLELVRWNESLRD
jgi:hypothetical protein